MNANITTIQRWFKIGILEGRRGIGKQSKLWIYLDTTIIKRLNGTATFDITVRTFASIMKDMNISKEKLVQWIKLKNHELLRLKRGSSWRFYVKPNNLNNAIFDRSM